MKISYHYVEDGYTDRGEKIPDIPVVHLVIRAGKYRAHGAAIIDTGFDGGIYPNMEIVRMFEGVEPTAKTIFENPLYGASEFEIYIGEASLYYGAKHIGLGRVRIYIPTEPELLTGEVLVGREVLNNKIRSLTMNMPKRRVLIEL